MAVILARSIYITYCIRLGFGRHLHTLLEADVPETVRLTRHLVILEALSLWTWALPKLPVAILLYRIFGKFRRGLGAILYSLVAVLIAIVVVQTVVTFVKCHPISKNWNPTVPGKCWNPDIYTDIGYFAGAYSAALDFGLAFFASTQVFSLQMERSRKMLIAASLSLGIPAGVTTCIKLAMIASLNTSDITYSTVPLEVWNSVEGCALIVAACVPATRPVMRLLGKRLGEWRSLLSGRRSHGSAKAEGTDHSSGVSSKDRVARPVELERGKH
ncbi:integral membrane protein [Ophiocordyceps camponoti-floridani]|uniref:Integral membrane protein n=1 Tax=Ophiocordyceps camponoti-floridani TaxID=2030778 RepID=A0A8H4QB46_9HYPO|nr:integral membrane protein [Ophiocordyceps camponoti-floridani]